MKKILLFSAFVICQLQVFSQSAYHIEKSFIVDFPHDVANQVSYLSLPSDQNLSGTFTISITGSYYNQLNRGLLTKRMTFIKNTAANGGYFNVDYEVLDATGPLANQWHIGDFDHVNYRIPIYHLVSSGNRISVKIEAQATSGAAANKILEQSALSDPTTVVFSKSRQYKSIMQDRVGIGTMDPAERLSVNGNVRAKEVKVEMANWPDYVFGAGYDLMTLPALESHIKTHGHLPGIPKAREVEAEGIGLAEMNRKLLEKVEELTLHLIQQQKNIDSQGEEIQMLKVQLNNLR